jgi:hypothetical protein
VLLMTISEGKCYSEGEMAELLGRAGFSEFRSFPTAADRAVITARVPVRESPFRIGNAA